MIKQTRSYNTSTCDEFDTTPRARKRSDMADPVQPFIGMSDMRPLIGNPILIARFRVVLVDPNATDAERRAISDDLCRAGVEERFMAVAELIMTFVRAPTDTLAKWLADIFERTVVSIAMNMFIAYLFCALRVALGPIGTVAPTADQVNEFADGPVMRMLGLMIERAASLEHFDRASAEWKRRASNVRDIHGATRSIDKSVWMFFMHKGGILCDTSAIPLNTDSRYPFAIDGLAWDVVVARTFEVLDVRARRSGEALDAIQRIPHDVTGLMLAFMPGGAHVARDRAAERNERLAAAARAASASGDKRNQSDADDDGDDDDDDDHKAKRQKRSNARMRR